ncbi:MAG: AMP-binding protein [Tannerellaceae bacterium]|nr:AMP-binding protein [Tannerellaceae bacterium]
MQQIPHYITARQQQQLTLDGIIYTASGLDKLLHKAMAEKDPFLLDLYAFLKDWFAPDPLLTVHTSGSTGVPKQIQVRKEQMIQSACLTCSFFGLQPGNTALLCMSLQYIAGKMMVVRALVSRLNLLVTTPAGHPCKKLKDPVDFVAMVPLQVYNTLRVSRQKELLARCKTLIIGGGPVDASLEEALQELPVAAYVTYGMTETLSHIAVRRMNGPGASSWYTPFEKVILSFTEEDTLQIDAPLVANGIIRTNDIVELLPDGRFRMLGRKDNVVNSGGIKIQIEQVEAILKPHITGDFALTAVSDPKLGQMLVLLLAFPAESNLLKEQLVNILPKYQVPKHIFHTHDIPYTGSGKIDRVACRKLAEVLYSNSKNARMDKA